ncbi:hypothetical protein NDU88_003052 [Pleurodeles waltl]|uniref:Transmembrane protein n=1 Tax=Pleurodeles waltl TaxID=8319 RepID=A0AAV7RF77_PLEWA|nr:hypothetical protein NDU88_003052 [Pleurodeles waltl]
MRRENRYWYNIHSANPKWPPHVMRDVVIYVMTRPSVFFAVACFYSAALSRCHTRNKTRSDVVTKDRCAPEGECWSYREGHQHTLHTGRMLRGMQDDFGNHAEGGQRHKNVRSMKKQR